MPAQSITRDLPSLAAFNATPEGAGIWNGDDTLRQFVFGFARETVRQEEIAHDKGFDMLGEGGTSIVWGVGDLALKLSTPTSGQDVWRYGRASKPEDLIGQFAFMQGLQRHLSAQGDVGVRVPRQYLALRTHSNARLLVQERMSGCKSMTARLNNMPKPESDEVLLAAKSRVARAVRHPVYSLGLRGLQLFGADRHLHDGNILVQANIDLHSSNEYPLCIIDLPGNGVAGTLAVKALAFATR